MSSYIEIIRRPKTPIEKVISVMVNIVCTIIVLSCLLVCVSTLNCRMNNVITSIGGYSPVVIAPTGSMRKSGFEAGQVVLVKKVDPRALKGDQVDEDGNILVRGDIIAFYKYYSNANDRICPTLPVYTIDKAKQYKESVSLSLGEFLGNQNSTIQNAGKTNCDMIFHHIKEIREGQDGKLYFKTYGSSNGSADIFWISEDVIVGKYYENGSPIILTVFQIFSSSMGIIMLICIPLLAMMVFVVIDIFKGLSLATLESNVLNGKLSLTDPVCVVNHIGFNMSQKTKYRVLAQLTSQERIESVSYLWQSPKDVQAMKKHYIKQKLLMHFDEERVALKNEYAPLLVTNGKKAVVAEREYNKKLHELEKREDETIKKLKEISKKAQEEKLEGYNMLDTKVSLKNAKVKLKKGESLHIGPHKSNVAKKIVNEIEKNAITNTDIDETSHKDIEESIDVFKHAKIEEKLKKPTKTKKN